MENECMNERMIELMQRINYRWKCEMTKFRIQFVCAVTKTSDSEQFTRMRLTQPPMCQDWLKT